MEHGHPSLEITTGCRLHFGLLVRGDDGESNYGGCGLVLDEPGFRLVVSLAERDETIVADSVDEEFRELVDGLRNRVRTRGGLSGCFRIRLERTVPRHAGLGSGTQLAAAVATGLVALQKPDVRPSAAEIARLTGRGRRSSIGLHGFERGGFLVDEGRRPADDVGRLGETVAFPDEWRVVLVTPVESRGLSSNAEREAFSRLPNGDSPPADRLADLVRSELVPALRAADFRSCSRGLHEYGVAVGNSFSSVQFGTYSHRSTTEIVALLRRHGVEGVGQSSWGPTVFALAEDERDARRIAELVPEQTSEAGTSIRIVQARNRGVDVRRID